MRKSVRKSRKKSNRKMSKNYCKKTPCKKMGFSQKASCRPYKNCYIRKKFKLCLYLKYKVYNLDQ